MGQLLLDKDTQLLHPEEGDDARTLARAWTLTVLPRLDGLRKRSVVQFLYESGLITKDHVVIDLTGAHLAAVNLTSANLKGANLRGAYMASANLTNAYVSEKQLDSADSLKGATMPNGRKYENWLKIKRHRDRAHGENGGTS